jgi:GNAT superfamily N-acetyltransferase
LQSILDLSQRQGVMALTRGDDPAVLEALWERRRSLMEHLARNAAHFWVAENDGEVVGYARSISRPSPLSSAGSVQHLELTEFFVLPGLQSHGVGGELLKRAFPPRTLHLHRSIVATSDSRALSLYLRSGVYPHFTIINFDRQPQISEIPTDLEIQPMTMENESLDRLASIDASILGFRRDEDHSWLMSDRQAYLYLRRGVPVGYGYVGYRSGPFALLDANDFPAVLAHGEAQAALAGFSTFGIETPMVNHHAVEYLLRRGFRLAPFIALFLCDETHGRFENYLMTAPPFFL